MNIRPIMPRLFARKSAAKGAKKAVNSGAASEINAGLNAIKKPFYKTPKFRNIAIGVAAAIGAAIAIPQMRYKGHDELLDARIRAYAETRDMTQAATDKLATLNFRPDYRSTIMRETAAEKKQHSFDLLAFRNVLKDNGYKEAADSLHSIFPLLIFYVGSSDREGKQEWLLQYLKNIMPTSDYKRHFTLDPEDRKIPYYLNIFCRFMIDKITFENYLDENELTSDSQLMKDFEKACELLEPRKIDYLEVHDPDVNHRYSYRPDEDKLETAIKGIQEDFGL